MKESLTELRGKRDNRKATIEEKGDNTNREGEKKGSESTQIQRSGILGGGGGGDLPSSKKRK